MMRFGVHLGNFGGDATAERILRVARRAEGEGFDSVWVSDHVAVPVSFDSASGLPGSGGASIGRVFDALTTLAVVAGATDRVELGTSVLVLPIRHPVATAKAVATLDCFARGRLLLGVGAGWLKEEFAALGAPDYARRRAAFDESVEVMRRLWREPTVRFSGQVYQFDAVHSQPRPWQRDAVPLLVGGYGDWSLRRAAVLGGWIGIRQRPAALSQSLQRLALMARKRGANLSDLRVVARCRYGPGPQSARVARELELSGSSDEVRSDVARYREAGVTDLVLDVCVDDPDQVEAALSQFADEVVRSASR